jgi:DNA invertase Pin-like site-specific DNA recombinase
MKRAQQPRKRQTRLINPNQEYFDSTGRVRTFPKQAINNPGLREKILARVEAGIKAKERMKKEKKAPKKKPPPKTMTHKQIERILVAAGFKKINPGHYHHPKHGGITFTPAAKQIVDRRIIAFVWKFKR